MYVRSITYLGSWLITSAVIKSKPSDFFRGNLKIAYWFLAGEKCFGGGNICSDESRNCSTSLIFSGRSMVLCGWKVSAKWFAKILALSSPGCA